MTLPASLGLQDGAAETPAYGPEAVSAQELYRLFEDPPSLYRPMVRWWWNGDRVTSEELLRELDVLKDAGIGGVEINPILFPSEADPMGSKPLLWMSDEWIAALKAVLEGARQRGMTCDMIVGSGWPFGGEFLSRADQTQMMALGTREVQGPTKLHLTRRELIQDVSPDLVSSYKDSLKELMSTILVPYELSDLEAGLPVAWSADSDAIEVEVPEGRHVLYFLVKLTGYMAVINGAPGASGPVLNHYSADAVARYLNRISDRLIEKIGPLKQNLRAFFTDSIELEGANWCDDLLVEFRQRRGYDLAPYLPFVLFRIGAMGNEVSMPYGAHFSADFREKTERVRYDFEITKRELFNEHFVATFVTWCRSIGVSSRMQAYGRECDAISASMMVDIPECETWIHREQIERFGDEAYTHGRSYSMINKYVSSAAHLAGKRLISCEEMTNTEDPFHTTLDRIKVAGDQSMLSGVTQSILHGFNYSPLSAPFPGWVRYGTYFSERNTWWPYFHLWTTYRARLSLLFQHAEMQADLAILPPDADMAARHGFQRDPFPSIVFPPYLFKLWEVIHQNGSGCDYLSEQIIARSSIRLGRLLFRSRSYRAIILPSLESLQPETSKKLRLFVESGGTVLFLDRVPAQSEGLEAMAMRDQTVKQNVKIMREQHPSRTPLLKVPETGLTAWFQEVQRHYVLPPMVSIDQPTEFISLVSYRREDQNLFFFSHYGPEEVHTFKANFHQSGKDAWLWDPETGQRSRLDMDTDGAVALSLGPSQSRLLVFERSRPSTTFIPENTLLAQSKLPPSGHKHAIDGPWTVYLESVTGGSKSLVMERFEDLNPTKELADFAGTITYTSEVKLEAANLPKWLSLGRVHSVSQVAVNGKDLGVRWYGNHQYAVTSAVQSGANTITIRIVTTLGNYMQSLKENRVARRWTAGTPRSPVALIEAPAFWSVPGTSSKIER